MIYSDDTNRERVEYPTVKIKHMKTIIPFLLLLLISTGDLLAQLPANKVTTFILVRHAEKMDDGEDPVLSPDGLERVNLLARMMSEIEFDAVYSTPFNRTLETARSVAEQNQLEISEYESGHPESTVAYWMEKHRGDYILVTGHSNTIPQLANALLKREHFKESFQESDYENLLIITISTNDERGILHMKY